MKRIHDCGGAFQIVHYSLQANHLHLLVEAHDKRNLTRGMLGFASALARAINKLRRRHGKLWAHRYHARELTSPLAVRRALIYVLRNGAKHGATASEDRFSSAHAFDGFTGRRARRDELLDHNARSWLLLRGWRRHGLIRAHETPTPAPRGVVIFDYLVST